MAILTIASRASPPFSAFCIGVRPRCDLESKRRQPSRERTLAQATASFKGATWWLGGAALVDGFGLR
jgi:hypothetical protein